MTETSGEQMPGGLPLLELVEEQFPGVREAIDTELHRFGDRETAEFSPAQIEAALTASVLELASATATMLGQKEEVTKGIAFRFTHRITGEKHSYQREQ